MPVYDWRGLLAHPEFGREVLRLEECGTSGGVCVWNLWAGVFDDEAQDQADQEGGGLEWKGVVSLGFRLCRVLLNR